MPDKTATKLCPTCGTRVTEEATRCLVCGAELGSSEKPAQAARGVQSSRMPEITLSLPAAILLLALFLAIGAIMVFFALREKPEIVIPPTLTNTPTITVTPTLTPTQPPPTSTDTPQPTPTPIVYKVVPNDTCSGIAVAFKVSVLSIITLNNLPAACDNLVIGQELLIPQPTPTSTSLPTITPNPATQTAEACERVDYTVQEGDTLGTIANSYNVPMEAIREYNGLPNDTVFLGMPLTIPLCARPTPIGPTATPTPPPPYAAPPLLLPQDGAPFTLADDSIALQWGSVGTLRDNEAYQIIVEDVTEGKGRRLIDYVTDTKYLVPSSFRLSDNVVHTFRWWVVTVRQTGTDTDGNPIWEPAGVASAPRVFTWSGAGKPPSPTP